MNHKTKKLRTFFAMALCLCGLVTWGFGQTGMQDSWKNYGKMITAPANVLGLAIANNGDLHLGIGSQILVLDQNGVEKRRYGAFSNLRGIAIDSDGICYTMDVGSALAVKVYNSSGVLQRSWGATGSGDGNFAASFSSAYGVDGCSSLIAVFGDEVFCLDPNNYRIQVFSKLGTYKRKWGSQGALSNQFSATPTAMTVTADGKVMIWSDWDRSTASDKHMNFYDLQGSLINSTQTGFRNIAPSQDGLWFGCGNNGGVIYAYDSSGFQKFTSSALSGSNFNWNTGIAVSQAGDVWVAVSNKLVRFDRKYEPADKRLSPSGIPQPVVLSISQRANTALMDIDYQVTDADSATVTTAALAFRNNGNSLSDIIPLITLAEGTAANIGSAQTTSQIHRLTWNVGADQTASFVSVNVEVYAKDDRGLYPFHWITLPDGIGGSGSLTISARPLANGDLFQLWLWLVATKDSEVVLRSDGIVYGTSGVYANQALASGSSTVTASGRAYLLQRLGVRTITAQELARAQAGRYNFESVSAYSVVKIP